MFEFAGTLRQWKTPLSEARFIALGEWKVDKLSEVTLTVETLGISPTTLAVVRASPLAWIIIDESFEAGRIEGIGAQTSPLTTYVIDDSTLVRELGFANRFGAAHYVVAGVDRTAHFICDIAPQITSLYHAT